MKWKGPVQGLALAAVGIVAQFIFSFPKPVAWALLLLWAGVFVATLPVSWGRILRRRHHNEVVAFPSGPILNFAGWAETPNVGKSLLEGRDPGFIAIHNVETGIAETARDVRAHFDFLNKDRTQGGSFLAEWFAVDPHPSGMIGSGWRKSVNIDYGRAQRFLLCAWGPGGQVWLYRNASTPIGRLDDGYWTVKLRVTSSNALGFAGTLGFHLNVGVSGFNQDIPFFKLEEVLPPLCA